MSSELKAAIVTVLIVAAVGSFVLYGIVVDPIVFIGVLVLIALLIGGFLALGFAIALYDGLCYYFRRRNEQKGT